MPGARKGPFLGIRFCHGVIGRTFIKIAKLSGQDYATSKAQGFSSAKAA